MGDLRYEDAAEQQTVTGWCCKKCSRFWGKDEHMARYCCSTSQPCDKECGRRTTKGHRWCEECANDENAKRFAALPRVEWDGSTPLCTWDNDKFFFDVEQIEYYLEDNEGATLESLQLVMCEPANPRPFDINDYLYEEMPPDCAASDLPGAKEAEKAVNDFIEKSKPLSWFPTNKAIILESLGIEVALPEAKE